MTEPSERIQTERLVLLANGLGDGFGVNARVPRAQVIFGAIEMDRRRLREFLPWVDLVKNERDEADFLRQCEENRKSFQGFDYGVYLADGTFVGNCGLHTVSKSNARAEIGYWIVGEFEGRGYMTEAIRGLVSGAFAAGFHRLEIRCNAENRKSFSVAERLGFRLEGELREDSREHEEWRNTRIYGMLARDFVSETNSGDDKAIF